MLLFQPRFHCSTLCLGAPPQSLVAVIRAKPDFFRTHIGFSYLLDSLTEFGSVLASAVPNADETVLDSTLSESDAVAALSSSFASDFAAVNPFSSPVASALSSATRRLGGRARAPVTVYTLLLKGCRAVACLLGGSAGEAVGLPQAITASSSVHQDDVSAIMHTVAASANTAVKAALMSLLADLLLYEVCVRACLCLCL